MKLIISLILVISSFNCLASIEQTITKDAIKKNLHNHKTWRQLIGFYFSNPIFNKSDIKNNDFFISSNGKYSPKSELIATIKAYNSPIPKDQNQHPQCKYPARYMWLKKHINLTALNAPSPTCTAYQEWLVTPDITSVNLLFVSGYLANPSSFQGHLLIRFDNSTAEFLNNTTNYGAIIPENENPILYIVKGLFGGYDATYTDQQFYRFNHNYVESDMRDIWQYEFNLSIEERQFLAAHTWELLGQKFTYYFFRDNCAYRIGRLLELVVDAPLVSTRTPWAMPLQTVQKSTSQPDLIKQVTYIPSKEERFYQSYKKLTPSSESAFKSMIVNQKFSSRYDTLSTNEQIQLTNTLLDYTDFMLTKDRKSKPLKKFKKTIQRKRIILPAETSRPSFSGTPIDKTPKPSLIEFSTLHASNNTDVGIRLRPTNYDILSLDDGRIPNAIVALGDVKFRTQNNDIELEHFTFVHLLNLNTPTIDLPNVSRNAWQVKLGIEKDITNRSNVNVGILDIGIGKSRQIFDQSVIYGLSNIRLQGGQYWLIGTPTIGLISTHTKKIKSHIMLGQSFFGQHQQPNHLAEVRFSIQKNIDFRLKVQQTNETKLQISNGYYW